MKKSIFLLVAIVLSSCSKIGMNQDYPETIEDSLYGHDELVLGNQLDNPYSLENMKSAYEALYPTKSGEAIVYTDNYVRFLPSDDAQMEILKQSGLTFIDHPVDYEIVREGDYYHDPTVEQDAITWQYSVVPKDYEYPEGIRYEILQRCFIAENSPATKSMPDIDWEAVEAESFKRTGNESFLIDDENLTKAGGANPSGRITISDPDYAAGQPSGVAGVKVECNVFVKFASAYTDKDGYYQIPKNFKSNPRYRLVFVNEKGFSIGFNTILYKGSISSLGRHSPSGVNINVDASSERKLFRRCVANNAAYEYIDRCTELGIATPPSSLVLWMFDSSTASSAVLLHHGTFLPTGVDNAYYEIFSWIVREFSPDITLGTKESKTFRQIYALTIHEIAHTSHFAKVGVDYWNTVINYTIRSSIKGEQLYGDATQENSGYCAMSEMWAYYMENKFVTERYGGENPLHGSDYWFHPQIFTYLESRGFTSGQLFAPLDAKLYGIDNLRAKLIALYPAKKTTINQVFNRYEN